MSTPRKNGGRAAVPGEEGWESRRIASLPPYIFEKINREKYAARSAGRDVVDLGMGNPDLPTPAHIIAKLTETVRDPKTHRYSASRGIPGLRRAISTWYGQRYGVSLDPDREAVAVIGSKEGLCHFALAAFNPGDAVFVPNPTYPAHIYPFAITGVRTRDIPLRPENDFLPCLGALPRPGARTRALLLSFPHNPTTRTATLELMEEAVAYCRRHDLFMIHDLAYGELVFDAAASAPSILQVPGARERCIEFCSLSKTYSMAGWRVGFAVGNEKLVGALARLKSYYDYGIFTPIQVAAAAALLGPQDCVAAYREAYRQRRDLVVRGLARVGWPVPASPATMYLWAPLPEQCRGMGSLAFSSWLLEKANVAVSPGVGFGAYGEGYVRLALVENEHRLRQAVRSIGRALKDRS